MKELAIVVAALSAVMVAFVGAVMVIVYVSEASACSNLRSMTGVETNVSVSLGCMVKYRGEWVSREVMTNRKQDVTLQGSAK